MLSKSQLLGGDKQVSVIPVTHDIFTVIKDGNLEVLDRLMREKDFNVNLTRWSGFSLLHRAATEGQTDVCDALLKHGARVNQRSVWGWHTPLHLALANGYEDTAKFLIEQGANLRAKNKDKEDCCDYAQRRGFKELAASFRLRLARYEMQQLANERKKRVAKSRELMEQMEVAREASEALAAASTAAELWERPASTSQFTTRSRSANSVVYDMHDDDEAENETNEELKALDASLKSLQVCMLCNVNPRDHILIPCRHIVLCGKCCDDPVVKAHGCPKCKTEVKNHYKK